MKKFLTMLLVILFFFSGNISSVLAGREDPGVFIKRMLLEASQARKEKKSSEEKRLVVEEFVKRAMDLRGIAMRALGGNLARELSSEQKAEYFSLFLEYFLKYNSNIDSLVEASSVTFNESSRTCTGNDYVQIFGIMLSKDSECKVWFGVQWEPSRDTWVISNSGVQGLDNTVVIYQTEFNAFVINGNPKRSVEAINSYLKCRLQSCGIEECKSKQLAARRGAG